MTSLPRHSPTNDVAAPVIDWTNIQTEADIARTIQTIVMWVSGFPREHRLQVYLPSVAHRSSMRRLQQTLLGLGCTVTCRMQPLH